METKKTKGFRQVAKVFFSRGLIAKISFGIVALFFIVALFGPLMTKYTPYEQDLTQVLADPSGEHLLGTDDLGRDVLTRVLYGARTSFLTGIFASIWAALLGITLGLIAGYYGKLPGQIIMRYIDAQMSIPNLILTMFVAMLIGRSIIGLSIVIGIGTIPLYTRLINGMVLSIKENDYVVAARLVGQSKIKIMIKHILPNCFAPLIVAFTMNVGAAIMIESGLAYLGVGIAPPTPAWGVMVSDGFKMLTIKPFLALIPGFCIMLVVVAINIFGDGIRDALDPKLRGKL